MAETLPGEYHHLTFDNLNFFTGPKLVEDLLTKKKFYSTGTMRKDRAGGPREAGADKKTGRPKLVARTQDKNAERGEALVLTKGEVVFTSLMDTKVVNLLSTYYASDEKAQVPRRQKNDKGEWERLPVETLAVHRGYYNMTMGFVDLADYLRKKNGVDIKCRKYTKAVWGYCVNTLRVQSYLYAKADGYKGSHGDFIESVILGLRSQAPPVRERGRKRSAAAEASIAPVKSMTQVLDDKRKAAGQHWPSKHPTLRRRCWWCMNHKHERHDVDYYCSHCDVFMHPECMEPYHTH